MIHGDRSDPYGELKRAYEGHKTYKILDSHYENIGKIDDLFEDENGRLLYIGTKTRLLSMKSTLIPTEIIKVNDKRGIVQVSVSEDQIEHAPSLEEHEELTPELEHRLRNYFGLRDPGLRDPRTYDRELPDAPPRESPIADRFAPDGRIDVRPGERERGRRGEEFPAGHARNRAEGGVQATEATEAAERKGEELDVDLSTVKGTGSGGRVLVRDIKAEAAKGSHRGVEKMSERKAYHVTPHQEGGWKVEAEGATRASSTHQTKEEAVDNARELAKGQEPSQVLIHRQDGTIETEHTYG